MRIGLIGATGVLGRRTLPRLVAAGHDVTALVRTGRDGDVVARAGARAVRGDVLEPGSLPAALDGAEAVINLASAIPATPQPGPGDWAINDRVRREGTRNVLAAALGAGARHYVHASVYLVYGDDAGDEVLTEASPLRPSPAIRSAVCAEEAVRAATLSWTILRPGWLYDAGAWHSRDLLHRLRAGEAVVLADAPAWRSPVHAIDVARAVVFAVEQRPEGEVFNVADDHPVRSAELLDGLADLLGGPRPARLRRAEAAARLGPGAAALARSARLATGHIRAVLGFTPRYPDWRAGFETLLSDG